LKRSIIFEKKGDLITIKTGKMVHFRVHYRDMLVMVKSDVISSYDPFIIEKELKKVLIKVCEKLIKDMDLTSMLKHKKVRK